MLQFGNMKRNYIVVIALIFSLNIQAQDFEYSIAKRLGDNINSNAEEINPRITEDGEMLYFTRAFSKKNKGGEYAGQDIWYSIKEGNEWSDAKNLKALNNGDNNAVVGLNRAADKLYLINNYTAHPRRTLGLVVSERNDKLEWGQVKELPVKVEVQSDHYGFYLSPDEEVLIISMMAEGSLGEEDLFVSFSDEGNWSSPKHLDVVNSTGYEISPFLSADKQTLYFSSNGFQGKGDADVFSSTRLDDTWNNWSEPKNLGTNINSSAFDAYFMMTELGEVYFSSNRQLGGMSDIYSSRATEIKMDSVKEEVVELIEEEREEEVEPDLIADEMTVEEEPQYQEIPSAQIVFFGFESATLTAENKIELKEVVKTMNSRKELVLELTGHSDVIGDADYNYTLSERRAKAVSQFLTESGVDASRMNIYFHGETKLLNDGRKKIDHRENRRVEIFYLRVN